MASPHPLIARFLLSARARPDAKNRRACECRRPCQRRGCAAKFLNLWVASPTPDAAAGILPRASAQAFDQAADASTAQRNVAKRKPRHTESCHEDTCREARRDARARAGGDDCRACTEPAAGVHSAI